MKSTPEEKWIRLGWKRRLAAGVLGMVGVGLNLIRRMSVLFRGERGRRRVLLMEPYCLGDVISLEPLTRYLKDQGFEVCICSKPVWRPLIPEGQVDEWIEERVPWTSYDEAAKYRLGGLVSPRFRGFVRELRRWCNGAVGVDCRGDIRSVMLLHLAGCDRVLTLSRYLGSDLKMTPFAAEAVEDTGSLRRWELNLRFLPALGGRLPEVPEPPRVGSGRKVDTHEISSGCASVGLVPVAPWPGRLWPGEKWGALCRRLSDLGYTPVGMCGPGQSQETSGFLGRAIEVREAGSIGQWLDNLRELRFVISLDSGPMHLADAAGVPVIGLFGPGKLPLWSPSGPHSLVVHHQERSEFFPCHQVAENIEYGRRFMDWIEVDDVVSAVRKLEDGLCK
ncbi:MAG: glycosyltransferase family 9 protein [Verrucomicrobia bacterium]|nr:glycosyltransferase family 9 protein [Verrucomicrobiota bacterium]